MQRDEHKTWHPPVASAALIDRESSAFAPKNAELLYSSGLPVMYHCNIVKSQLLHVFSMGNAH